MKDDRRTWNRSPDLDKKTSLVSESGEFRDHDCIRHLLRESSTRDDRAEDERSSKHAS